MDGEQMQIVEMCFNTLIEKHGLFKEEATHLLDEIPELTPEIIDQRCRKLTKLHHRLITDKEYFFSLIELMGPGILETAYIGEFQRALKKSLTVCNSLYEELQSYKNKLLNSQLSQEPQG